MMKNYLKEVVLIFLACSNIDLYAKTEIVVSEKSGLNTLPVALESNSNATTNKLYLLLILTAITICYAFYKWRAHKKNPYY